MYGIQYIYVGKYTSPMDPMGTVEEFAPPKKLAPLFGCKKMTQESTSPFRLQGSAVALSTAGVCCKRAGFQGVPTTWRMGSQVS